MPLGQLLDQYHFGASFKDSAVQPANEMAPFLEVEVKAKACSWVALLFIIVFGVASRAETIKGQSAVYDHPNGTIVMVLYEGVSVDCGPPENGWCKILVAVQTKPEETPLGPQHIPAGHSLYDGINGSRIGVTYSSLYVLCEDSPDGNYCWAEGYVRTYAIQSESIPENRLSEFLQKKRPVTLTECAPLIESIGLKEISNLVSKDMSLYMLSESHTVSPHPEVRIALFFEHGELLGLFYSRHISVPGAQAWKRVGNLKSYVFGTPDSESARQMISAMQRMQ